MEGRDGDWGTTRMGEGVEGRGGCGGMGGRLRNYWEEEGGG